MASDGVCTVLCKWATSINFALTERNFFVRRISLWDAEKERLVLLATKALYSVKYDFISLKILDFNRVPILLFDTVVTGDLIYPTSSLAP